MTTAVSNIRNDHIELSRILLERNYLGDSRPWVVAYSGGKDSTLTLQLIYNLMLSLPAEERKPLHILASDTRVEAPNIENYIHDSLAQIQRDANEKGLPVNTHLVTPSIENSFWVNLIGKGYPPPTRWFRWCTSKMKLKPVRATIQEIADQDGRGSVILALGTRKSESSGRSQRMEARLQNNRGLNPHNEIPNALVMSPIAHWTDEQVWEYLAENNPPPWGGSHDYMLALYRDANSGECPVIMDGDTPSCGGSRFGCWTCTVVKEDRSMKGFIAAGNERFVPLYEFRNWLKEIREQDELRNKIRRNGEKGIGPFSGDARRMILDELLSTEKKFGEQLITDDELIMIQKEWAREFDVRKSALRLAMKYNRRPMKRRET